MTYTQQSSSNNINYHLKVKFPSPKGVGEIHSEQVVVRECYVQELNPTKGGVNVVGTVDNNRSPPPPLEFQHSGEEAKNKPLPNNLFGPV